MDCLPACPYVYTWLVSAIAALSKRHAIFFLFVLNTLQLFGQEISIKQIELEGGQVFIYYSLVDSTPERSYIVNLYTSKDNFVHPLQKVTGDIGIEIHPGINKKITWNANEEFGHDFEGIVSFEIRSKIYVPFLALQDFNYKKLKRGTVYEIAWTGGRPQNILNFDLYRQDKRVATFSNIANVGHHSLVIPTHVKQGDGYQLKISDIKNKDELVHTQTFCVARKVPLLLKVVPVVMLGVAGYLLIGHSVDPHKNDIDYFPHAPK